MQSNETIRKENCNSNINQLFLCRAKFFNCEDFEIILQGALGQGKKKSFQKRLKTAKCKVTI